MGLDTHSRLQHATATADAAAKTGRGFVRYIFIEGNAGGGRWVIRDGTDTTGAAIGDFTVAVGSNCFEWPVQFDTGLFLDAGASPGRISVLFE